MYECDCYEGYELNKNGYSCQELNNTYLQDGRSEEDILYQKGVSFSAKLESSSNTNNNFNNNYIDLNSDFNTNGIEETDFSLETINNIQQDEQLQQQQEQQEPDYTSSNQINDDNISFSSDDVTSTEKDKNSQKVPDTSQKNQKQSTETKTSRTTTTQTQTSLKNKILSLKNSLTPGTIISVTTGESDKILNITNSQTLVAAQTDKIPLKNVSTTATATTKATATTTNAPSIPSISIIDLNNLQYSDTNDYYSKQDMSIYDDVNNNKLNLRQFNSDTYQGELLQKQKEQQQNSVMQKQEENSFSSKLNSNSKIILNHHNNNNNHNNDDDSSDSNSNDDSDADDGDDDDSKIDYEDNDYGDGSSFVDKNIEIKKIHHKNNDNNDNSIAKGNNNNKNNKNNDNIITSTATVDASVPFTVTLANSNNEMNSNIKNTTTILIINDKSLIEDNQNSSSSSSSSDNIISPTSNSNSSSSSSISSNNNNSNNIGTGTLISLTSGEMNFATDINSAQQQQKLSVSSLSSSQISLPLSTLKDMNSTQPLRISASSWQSCNLDCGNDGLCEFVENDLASGKQTPTMRCMCPFGKTGIGCTQDLITSVPRFTHKSWLAFPALRGAYKHVQLRVEFRPESFDGIILLTGERDDLTGDFMAVLIHQGFIEFWFDCGSGVGSVRSKETVELNQWNTVTINRHRWDAWLMLNNGQRVQGRSKGLFSRITFREPVFLGGTGNITGLAKRLPVQNGMLGCIRRFIANEHEYKFVEHPLGDVTKGFDIQDCTTDKCVKYPCQHGGKCLPSDQGAVCLCPLGFGGDLCEMRLDLQVPSFNGSSYLRFAPLEDSALIWLELQIILKPHQTDGIILYSGHEEHGDFISLSLNMGYVEFAFDLGSGPAIVRSDYPIILEQWHTIRVSRTARLAVLKIDKFAEVMTISSNGFWHLSLPHSLYLGGIQNLKNLPIGLNERGSFVGCIQKVEINGRTLSIISEALAGSNVDNCPHACITKPCGPLAQCLPFYDSYECRCNPYNIQCNKAEEVALKEFSNNKESKEWQYTTTLKQSSSHVTTETITKSPINKYQKKTHDSDYIYNDDGHDNDDDDDNDDDEYEDSDITPKPETTIKKDADAKHQPSKQQLEKKIYEKTLTTTTATESQEQSIETNKKQNKNEIVIITEKQKQKKQKPQSPQISDIYYYYYDKDDDYDDNKDKTIEENNKKERKTTYSSITTEKLPTQFQSTINNNDNEQEEVTTPKINKNNNIKASHFAKPIIKFKKKHKKHHQHHQHHHHHSHNQPHHYEQHHHHHHHQQQQQYNFKTNADDQYIKNHNQNHPKINLYKKMLFNTEINTKNNSELQLKGYKKDNNLSYKIDQYITLEKDDQLNENFENTYNSNNENNMKTYNNYNQNQHDNIEMKETESSTEYKNEDIHVQTTSQIRKRKEKEEKKEENNSEEYIKLKSNNYKERKHKNLRKRNKFNKKLNEKLKMPLKSTSNYVSNKKEIENNENDQILYRKYDDDDDGNNEDNLNGWQQDDEDGESKETNKNLKNGIDNKNKPYNNDEEENFKLINSKVFHNNKRKKFTNHKRGNNMISPTHHIMTNNPQKRIKSKSISPLNHEIPSDDLYMSNRNTEENFENHEFISNSKNKNNENENKRNNNDEFINKFDPETSIISPNKRRPDSHTNIITNNNIRDKSTSSAFLVDEKDFQTKELIKDMERIMKNADEYNYNPLKYSRPLQQHTIKLKQQQQQQLLLQQQQQQKETNNMMHNSNSKLYTDNKNIRNDDGSTIPNLNSGNFLIENIDGMIIDDGIISSPSHRKSQQHGACFTGTDSYFHYNDAETMSQIISYNVDLNLRFKTHSTNGIVLWTGRQSARDKDDYLLLGIENGYLHLRYNLGSGETNIQFNASKVSDGLWHRVRAIRNLQEGFLEVDGRKSIPQRSPGKLRQLNTDTGLYVGGMPDVSFYTRRRYYTGIVGCISEIVLAGELKLNLDPSTLGTARNVETGIL